MERMIRNSGVKSRFFLTGLILMILTSFLLVSCAGPQAQKTPAKGIYHIVKKGETAYGIARAYSIDLRDLAEINNIRDVSLIKEGEVIFIPDADHVIEDVITQAKKKSDDKVSGPANGKTTDQALPSKSVEKPPSTEASDRGAQETPSSAPVVKKDRPSMEKKTPATENEDDVKTEKGKLVWPVKGTVKTRFGIQPNKTYHNWIKIVCPAGTRVRAAAAGTVIFSASLKDFGETIIIRHANGFATVYTHLKKRYAKADQNIKKGAAIALAGEIDEAGDVYINFEIRLKGKARNPLIYLP